MLQHLIQRTVSFTLAAALTLGMLGGIDRLSAPDPAAAQWAQQQHNPHA